MHAELSHQRLVVSAPILEASVSLGGPAPIDWLLRVVPRALAAAPWWLKAVDPVASRIVRAFIPRQRRKRSSGVLRRTTLAANHGGDRTFRWERPGGWRHCCPR